MPAQVQHGGDPFQGPVADPEDRHPAAGDGIIDAAAAGQRGVKAAGEACPRARDRALALLPLYAGTRIAEIAALDVTDVRLSARKGELHLVGKGEKSRTVPVHPQLRAALAAWLAERPARAGADSPALFLSGRSTRLTTDAIDDAIQGITRAAALDDHVTSHVLRHTFGTELK